MHNKPLDCMANGHCWFLSFKIVMGHPSLTKEEKYLWLWLASQCTAPNFSCSFNYQQLSQALNQSNALTHRLLLRLRIMGFLHTPIPIWYGEPPASMVTELRLFKLVIPPC